MHRREFFKAGVALTFAAQWPMLARADVNFDPRPGTWRDFQITTRLEIAKPAGVSQAWIPLPSVNQKDWIKSSDSHWTTNGEAVLARDPHYGAEMLHVTWAASEAAPAPGDRESFPGAAGDATPLAGVAFSQFEPLTRVVVQGNDVP